MLAFLLFKKRYQNALFYERLFYKELVMTNRVANYHADRTNQKLYFVRLCCQQAEQAEEGQIRICHIESAILHLYGGYLAFLQEIARYYNLNQAEPTLDSINNALQHKTQLSPEVMRLQRLLDNDFLGEIVTAWGHTQYKPAPKVDDKPKQVANESDNSQRLPIIDVMATSSPLATSGISADMVRQWREQLLELIDTLREGMIEF